MGQRAVFVETGSSPLSPSLASSSPCFSKSWHSCGDRSPLMFLIFTPLDLALSSSRLLCPSPSCALHHWLPVSSPKLLIVRYLRYQGDTSVADSSSSRASACFAISRITRYLKRSQRAWGSADWRFEFVIAFHEYDSRGRNSPRTSDEPEGLYRREEGAKHAGQSEAPRRRYVGILIFLGGEERGPV